MKISAVAAALLVCILPGLTLADGDRQAADKALEPDAIRQVMRQACDYQLDLQARPSARADNGWIRSAFYTGVMAAWRATGDAKYLEQAFAWADRHDWTPPPADDRHADNQACIQVYAELHEVDPARARLKPSLSAFDRQMAAPNRGRVDWWWCDALFMAPPGLARVADVTDSAGYLHFMDEMWWDATEFLFDKEAGLYYRDANYFEGKTRNGQKIFWSRGNGWVMGGIARVLQYLPGDWPTRPSYIELLQTMSASVAKLQQEDGLWRPSLHDPAEFPTPETSGSAFFTFAIAWGINNGHLDRETYGPVVEKGWKGLVSKLTPEGRLTHVQRVAGSPGKVNPDDTHEYAVGAFLLAGEQMLKFVAAGAVESGGKRLRAARIDFGAGPTEKGFTAVALKRQYSPARGFGWIDTGEAVLRDRGGPDALRRDYIFGRAPAVFRLDLQPGTYRMTLIMGDMQYGNHVLAASVNSKDVNLPVLRAEAGEFATLTAAFNLTDNHLLLTLDSPVNNWVINALMIEPADQTQDPQVSHQRFAIVVSDTWADMSAMPDPTADLLGDFRKNQSDSKIEPTGQTRDDYLKVIAGNVDYFRQHQDANGAIIDPHRKVEFQYSTPCFAAAAAALVVHAGRDDLLEPAAKAMDWSCHTLKRREGANAHEDFYAPPLAHALRLLKGRVDEKRYQRWVQDIRSFKPIEIYRSSPGGGNWNVVALSGEYLFHKLGIRDDMEYVEQSLAAQGRHFNYPWGLYTEGPMAYDLFPRMWAADMMAQGYDGKNAENLREALRRGAITSLFIQSPSGELPSGGRSAHHQWNEAQQCVTYEIFAAKAIADGDAALAGAYKRGAHLALASMMRWIRPSGEMWIVKNRFDPGEFHAYEGYSSHSQYNLLPMAMLVIAHHHAQQTQDVIERPAPADVGGFVIDLRPVFRKVFANAGGMYVEIETAADLLYDATGLTRVHHPGLLPQLGPSSSIVSRSDDRVSADDPGTTAAIGVAWQDVNGNWRRLAEFGSGELTSTALLGVSASKERVEFQLIYSGYFSGPVFVSERYLITPQRIEQTTELPNYNGPVQLVWPVLSDIGDEKTKIQVTDKTVTVSLQGSTQTFTAPGAESVQVQETEYPFRNGLARLGVAEFAPGAPARLVIEPLLAPER